MSETPRKRRRVIRFFLRAATGLIALTVIAFASLEVWQWLTIESDAPVVGVSWDTAWHARAGISTKNYEIALTRVGVKIQNIRPGGDDPEMILDRIDALMLTGGGDIDPQLYGADAADAVLVNRARDDMEVALIRGALKRDMPIFGICRGIHLLNVMYGGTLRNLRDDPNLNETHGIHIDSMSAHPIDIAKGSRIASILGGGRKRVNSFHGQAVDQIAAGLKVVAEAPDGVVEGIELPGHRFVVAVQWHPEVVPQQIELFEAFRDEARAYRDRKE